MANHKDGSSREGIENALRMLADSDAEFLPGAEQMKRMLMDIIFLLGTDTMLDPDLYPTMATVPTSEYKERLNRARELVALLGDALYKNQDFLNAVRQF